MLSSVVFKETNKNVQENSTAHMPRSMTKRRFVMESMGSNKPSTPYISAQTSTNPITAQEKKCLSKLHLPPYIPSSASTRPATHQSLRQWDPATAQITLSSLHGHVFTGDLKFPNQTF
jgi:hypothetical protein